MQVNSALKHSRWLFDSHFGPEILVCQSFRCRQHVNKDDEKKYIESAVMQHDETNRRMG